MKKITFVFNVVMMALQSYEKYLVLRIVALVTSIANPIINVVALKLGGRAITITAISLTISICCYAFYFFYARKAINLEFSFHGFEKDVLKEIFIFSGFLFLNSLTDQLTFSTDNIVLSAVSGTSAVAVYTVGSQFKNYFQQFSTSISSVFAPSVNMLVAQNQDKEALDAVFQRVGRIQFYVVSLILIGYISIGRSFIRLWAGTAYSDSFYIGLLLMLSVFIPSFQNVGLEIQKAFNKHKARSVVYFLVALLNVALTIPFAQHWGGIGAAAATLFTTFFGYVLFMNYYYWKRIGLDIPAFWKAITPILPAFLIPAIVGHLINQFWHLDSYMEILISATIISVIYGISVWLFSMNEYEKNLLRKPLQKVFFR